MPEPVVGWEHGADPEHTEGKIVQVDVIADPERLRQLDLAVLDNGSERVSGS